MREPCLPIQSTTWSHECELVLDQFVVLPLTFIVVRRQELSPKFVATFTDNPSSYEGHPFVAEAAVSLGGAEVAHFDWCNCLYHLLLLCSHVFSATNARSPMASTYYRNGVV